MASSGEVMSSDVKSIVILFSITCQYSFMPKMAAEKYLTVVRFAAGPLLHFAAELSREVEDSRIQSSRTNVPNPRGGGCTATGGVPLAALATATYNFWLRPVNSWSCCCPVPPAQTIPGSASSTAALYSCSGRRSTSMTRRMPVEMLEKKSTVKTVRETAKQRRSLNQVTEMG